MIGEELERVIQEGFGGELTGEDREKFEKARQENAEVLGYKLTGKPDVKQKPKHAKIIKKTI